MGVRLDLGSGKEPREGYISVDSGFEAQVQDDITTLATYANRSVDELFSNHSLEHIGRYDVDRTLANWFRVLKIGGKLEVVVPDLPRIMRIWLEEYDAGKDVWGWRTQTIFGNQDYPGMAHLWGYDARTLRQRLQGVGFAVTKVEPIWSHDQPSLYALAYKL